MVHGHGPIVLIDALFAYMFAANSLLVLIETNFSTQVVFVVSGLLY